MAAGFYHLIIEQGATFQRVLTIKDAAGSVVNTTNYTGEMDLRKEPDDSAEVLTLTNANGRVSMGGANGKITLLVSATDTGNLDEGEGVYDLKITSSGGVSDRFIEGTYSIRRGVTR